MGVANVPDASGGSPTDQPTHELRKLIPLSAPSETWLTCLCHGGAGVAAALSGSRSAPTAPTPTINFKLRRIMTPSSPLAHCGLRQTRGSHSVAIWLEVTRQAVASDGAELPREH